ncbi:hypothetical protein MP228_007812 [Amoeboaphelidium protococcarum]|nr:hypothetical protein MP228_007812 [Amoeboaphelidium protococcarum]
MLRMNLRLILHSRPSSALVAAATVRKEVRVFARPQDVMPSRQKRPEDALIRWNPDQPHRLNTIFEDPAQIVPNEGTPPMTGRSWDLQTLRKKSWEDLQEIYFTLLLERNRLLTRQVEGKKYEVEPWSATWSPYGGINSVENKAMLQYTDNHQRFLYKAHGTGRDEGAVYGVGRKGVIGGDFGIRFRKVKTSMRNVKIAIFERQDAYLKALKLHFAKYYQGLQVNVNPKMLEQKTPEDDYDEEVNFAAFGAKGEHLSLKDFDAESQKNIKKFDQAERDKKSLFQIVKRGRFLPQRGKEIAVQIKTAEIRDAAFEIVTKKYFRRQPKVLVKKDFAHYDPDAGRLVDSSEQSQRDDSNVIDMRPLHDRRHRSRRRVGKFRLKRGVV